MTLQKLAAAADEGKHDFAMVSASSKGTYAVFGYGSVGPILAKCSHVTTSLICERSFEFARRIVPLCDRMARSGFAARHVAVQLIKSGTSISANANEAQEGQTKPDFIAKLSVSRKEARETNFWLRFAAATNMVRTSDIAWELQESLELLRMIRKAIRTAQSRPDRGNSDPLSPEP